MRVAIVNDSGLALEALRRAIVDDRRHDVAWTACDGREAIQCCRRDCPDVILMDMIMPVMDGVEATRQIMASTPCPILIVTASIEANADRVYEALGYGAIDALCTPELGSERGDGVLLKKLEYIRLLRRPRREPPRSPAMLPRAHPRDDGILALGASTGGPQALSVVLGALPRPFPLPVLITQHLGADFVPGLARWLEQATGLAVECVERTAALRPGTVYLPAGERHLVCTGESVVTAAEPADSIHRPSVDVMFRALVERGPRGVAVLLTGMGRDGVDGLMALRRAGWWTIAQDEASSVVWGMPGEATRSGAAVETLPVDAIGRSIARAVAQLATSGVMR